MLFESLAAIIDIKLLLICWTEAKTEQLPGECRSNLSHGSEEDIEFMNLVPSLIWHKANRQSSIQYSRNPVIATYIDEF